MLLLAGSGTVQKTRSRADETVVLNRIERLPSNTLLLSYVSVPVPAPVTATLSNFVSPVPALLAIEIAVPLLPSSKSLDLKNDPPSKSVTDAVTAPESAPDPISLAVMITAAVSDPAPVSLAVTLTVAVSAPEPVSLAA